MIQMITIILGILSYAGFQQINITYDILMLDLSK